MARERVITMTGQPPVRIVDEVWPITSSACWNWRSPETPADSRGVSVFVRRHVETREWLVYGVATSTVPHERPVRRGDRFPPDAPVEVVAAYVSAVVYQVGGNMPPGARVMMAEAIVTKLPAQVLS